MVAVAVMFQLLSRKCQLLSQLRCCLTHLLSRMFQLMSGGELMMREANSSWTQDA